MTDSISSCPHPGSTSFRRAPRLLVGLLCAVVAAAAWAEPPGNVQPRSPSQSAGQPSSSAVRSSEPVPVTEVAPNALSQARAITEAIANGATPAQAGTLPSAVDNSTLTYFPPMMRQLAGDCTCYSSTYYYLTFMQARDEGLDASELDPAYDYPDITEPRDGRAAYDDRVCSPRFTFTIISAGGWGATGTRTAMERLTVSGAASASDFAPDADIGPWPPESAWVAALRNRPDQMYSIRVDLEAGITAAKQVLANGCCLVTRGDFGQNLDSYHTSASGDGINNHVMYERKPPPDPEDIPGLTHSFCIVGYDDNIAYYDADAGETRYGAFLMADSDAWAWYEPYDWWNWYNSTGPGGGGTKGFIWLAYDMFRERQLGFYNWPDLEYGDPCHDNEADPTMYYHDDRPQYRPKLYAVVGINHAHVNELVLTGGVGDTPSSPDFLSLEVFGPTNDYDTRSIDDSTRVAVDITDGVDYITSGAASQAFVKLSVASGAGSSGTITSADFFYDFDGNGIYQMVSSTDPTVTVTPGNSGYATVTFSLPAPIYVDDSNVLGPWTGTRDHPYQTIQDGIDHASALGTVYVFPGTYTEAVVMGDKISLIGAGAAQTVIDSQDTGEAVFCSGVTDVLIDGFTITSSGTTYNAFRSLDSTVMVRNCVATDSRSGLGAGNTGSLTLRNCMALDNPYQGVFQSGSPDVTLKSTTIVNSGDNGVVRWGTGMVTITNSIITGNADDIDGATGGFDVSYCDIGDGDFAGSNGNISLDPQFVSGPQHNCYLSQTAAGQGSDSPCLDAGSAGAWNTGLDDRTTRSDGVSDADQVDMGYHADYPLAITDVYWDQATTSVVLTFATEAGVDYTVESAEADAYSDGVSWSDLAAPVTAGGNLTTVSDNLSTNALTHDFRFYRVKRSDDTETSQQTAAVCELDLPVGFAVKRFFLSTPVEPDPDHAGVQDVLSTQLNYANVKLDTLTADTGLYTRATYSPGGGWVNAFSVAAGESYMLDVGDALPFPHTLRLTGYVTEEPVTVSVTRASFAVTQRWMAYSMPQATTLGALGLETAITPFWDSSNEVRLLPVGATAWSSYRWDGAKWYNTASPSVDAGATPIACGEGILFIHNGIPAQPDTLTWAPWYLRPPNLW